MARGGHHGGGFHGGGHHFGGGSHGSFGGGGGQRTAELGPRKPVYGYQHRRRCGHRPGFWPQTPEAVPDVQPVVPVSGENFHITDAPDNDVIYFS